jgi:branched-subunit amino acid aminotransferase/4-amino-4-deoxychorismate lyase
VRALDAHARRFSTSCAELFGFAPERTSEFMLAAAALRPATGRWFPRVELALVAGEPRLQLWVRPAPPVSRSVRLWLPGIPDARTWPRVKGPDLDWLTGLRQAAVAAGADEAVLLSPAGHVLEGTSTSLLWWRGETLCAPPLDAAVLPGITRSVVLAEAADVAFENVRPAELSGVEVWAVNALHGIRPVTGWAGAAIQAGTAARWAALTDGRTRWNSPS